MTDVVKRQVNLRLQEGLRRKIAADADKSGRSFNQWLVDAAEEKLRGETIETRLRSAMTELLKIWFETALRGP